MLLLGFLVLLEFFRLGGRCWGRSGRVRLVSFRTALGLGRDFFLLGTTNGHLSRQRVKREGTRIRRRNGFQRNESYPRFTRRNWENSRTPLVEVEVGGGAAGAVAASLSQLKKNSCGAV